MSPLKSYEEIGAQLGESENVEMGQMFGKASLKFKTKAFAAFHKESMVFKLGAAQIEEIRTDYPTAKNWDPSGKGRPMKDWFLVPHSHVSDWSSLAQQALEQLKTTL